jgi:hypothetical protein
MNDRLSWEDRKAMLLDQVEYFVRRLGCRLFGHKDDCQYEDAGDVSYLVGYYCLRCHRFDAVGYKT